VKIVSRFKQFNKQFLLHFYWQEFSIPFNEKTALSLKSAIATQNLNICKIIFWSNKDLSKNIHLKPLLPFLDHRIWDMKKEMQKFNININFNNDKGWLTGDMFRILVLGQYGGIYSDLDMVFLRDISPLLDYEFTYYWPCIKGQNGAIMRIDHNSNFFHSFLENIKLKKINPSPNSFDLGRELYAKVRSKYKNYSIFPTSWFDIDLGFENGHLRKMNNTNINEDPYIDADLMEDVNIPKHAFTWHWNNKWNIRPEINSKYYKCYSYINKLSKNLIY
jgi:hypothetical protein